MMHRKGQELADAHIEYLRVKAIKDHFIATLVTAAPGDSIAARKIAAEANEAYREFMASLANAEGLYERFKLEFRVLEAEYQAQYLEIKFRHEEIKRGVE